MLSIGPLTQYPHEQFDVTTIPRIPFQNGTSTEDVALYPDYDYSNYYNVDSAGHEFLYWTEGVILTIVSVFGIVGTLMSVGVIVRRDVRCQMGYDFS